MLAAGPKIGYQKAVLAETVAAFLEGHKPVGIFLRDALLSAETFDDALPILSSVPLASPMYLIVGGLTDGAVLTRDRRGLATETQDTSFFDPGRSNGARQPVPKDGAMRNLSSCGPPYCGVGWEVQTNCDPWVSETADGCRKRMAAMSAEESKACDEYVSLLYGDHNHCVNFCELYSDGRAEAAKASMAALNATDLDAASLAAGIFSAISTPPVLSGDTKFSAVMSAAHGEYTTTVRAKPSDRTVPPPQGVVDALRSFVRSLVRIPGL